MHCNMNEADVAFSSFYNAAGSQLQHAELSLSTPIHALEHDNFTGFFDDDPAPLLCAPLATTAATAAGGGGGGGTHKVVDAGCIPFVQIHTTDLQQEPEPGRSYRNGFRRKTAEIKSEAELIKSELAEAAAKERINATPTPPTAKTIGGEPCADLPLNKCPNCPFLSLCPLKTQTHISSCFGVDAQRRLQCPGCANVFYNLDVLSLHLSADHRLDPPEIAKLTGKPASEPAAKKPQQPPKSRIFIKNVDCLREPHRDQDVNQLPDFLPLLPSPPDGILDLLDDVAEAGEEPQQMAPLVRKPPVQKISIKSVDVLREPALLPYDFPMLHNNDNNMPEKPRQPKIYIRNVDILKEPMLLPGMGFNSGPVPAIVAAAPAEVFPAETLLTPTVPAVGPLPGFEPALAPLANMCGAEAFNFESVPALLSSSSSSSNNFSALDLDFGVDFEHSVQLVTAEPTPPELGPMPSSDDELSTQLDNYLPGNAAAAATVATPTTTTTSASKQKIFIKNVDILKAPQRGTLHLRTVDELNLMNRNEVEHLIVPHRELELSPSIALEPALVDFQQQQQQQQQQVHQQQQQQQQQQLQQPAQPSSAPLSYDDGYDLAEGLECWPWMDETVPAVIAAPETEQQAQATQLELPHTAEDILIKDFAQLYAPQTPNAATVPPLVPVTGSPETDASPVDNLSGLPVPPLVPLAGETPTTNSSNNEKPARIYVANNLLPAAVEQPMAGGTSVRGRPYGAKQAGGQAKRRPPTGAAQLSEGGKCTVEGCMFRFKSPATLEYHGRCHNGGLGSAQPMICPECRSTQFSNWNCLHTHLWRTHEIDMELYCCQLCSFKTPIYSRLVNTHAKIHSEERNYKCEQCGKGFKNTKQLKNHRRLHRTQGLGMAKPTVVEEQPALPVLHRCEDCGAAFKHRKTLREHLCKQRNEQPQCSTCQRVFSSKSSLKLHMRSHQANKRFKCDKCEYEANDHNAFRRHLATHREPKRYACPHCDFRAIQSTAYRIHLQKVHPEQELSTIIYKCNACKFSSINHGLLLVHQAKHHAAPAPEPSKIKVKSSSLLAHSTDATNNAKEQPELADNALNV